MPVATKTSPGWFNRQSNEQSKPQVRALTAAASRLDLGNRAQARRQRTLRQGWQLEAWSYRDSIGELRYATNFLANCMARMRVFPAAYGEVETDTPVPLAAIEGVPPEVVQCCDQAMKDLGNGKMAISGLLHSLSTNITVAGEGFLLGQEDPQTGVQTWSVRSIDEVIVYDDRYMLREVPTDPQGILGWIDLDPNYNVVARMWQPHPRFRILADSAVRALIDDCESLLILRRMIRATGRSRLAGRGILLMPNEMDIVMPNDDDDDPQAQVFMDDLTESMVTPISDEGVASSVVPMLVRGPGEFLPMVRLLEMASTFDEMSSKTREEIMGIIATGLDLPKEVLLGISDLNHWSAWQVDDNTFRHHVEPHVITGVDCLTSAYLRPYFESSNLDPAVIAEWSERILFWYDPTELVTHPDQTQQALNLHDRLVLSDETLLRVAGFVESDAPSIAEKEERLIRNQKTWPPNLVMEIMHQNDPALAVPPITVAGTVPGVKPGPTGGADVGAPPPAPPEAPSVPSTASEPAGGTTTPPTQPAPVEGPPPAAPITAAATPRQTDKQARLSRKLSAIDRQLRTRLQTAASAAVMAQLAKAGGRLRNKVAKDETLRTAIAHTRNEHVAAVLGRKVVEDTGLTAAGLMGNDWSTFKDQFKTWTADAQAQALKAASQIAGISDEDESMDVARASMATGLDNAWNALSSALDTLAQNILYQPHPNADSEAVVEALNPETIVPTGLIRASLAVAGGGDMGIVKTTLGDQGVIPLGDVVGQIGTGATISDLLTANGATTRSYTWEHASMTNRPFEPHEDLDGVQFASFDDPELANDGDFPDNAYFLPGDHTGCGCDYSPDWLLGDDSGSEDDSGGGSDSFADDSGSDEGGSVGVLDQPTDEPTPEASATEIPEAAAPAEAEAEAVPNEGGSSPLSSMEPVGGGIDAARENPDFAEARSAWFIRGANSTLTADQQATMTEAVRVYGEPLDTKDVIARGMGMGSIETAKDTFKVGDTIGMGASSFTPHYDLAARYTDAAWADGNVPVILTVPPGTRVLDLASPYMGEPEYAVAGNFKVTEVIDWATKATSNVLSKGDERVGIIVRLAPA